MNYWKYSLWLGITSVSFFLIVLLAPAPCSVFVWKEFGGDAGVLFPVLFLSWATGVIGIAYNNIFIDRLVLHKNIEIKSFKKHLPSLLSFPAIISFCWFCYRWYRGRPCT